MRRTLTFRFCLSCLLLLCLITEVTLSASAQSKQKPYIANIRVEVDTVKKNVRFKYDLLRAEPEDSIYVQLETPSDENYLILQSAVTLYLLELSTKS